MYNKNESEPKASINISRRVFGILFLAGAGQFTLGVVCKSGQYPPGSVPADKGPSSAPDPGIIVDLGTHVVESGENLTSIARDYEGDAQKAGCPDISVDDLVEANKGRKVNEGQGASERSVIQSNRKVFTGDALKIQCTK